ncbi:TPA: KilA-N domain-containing protein [Haemophilus influenzae]|uniref:KilA-N domain-containing protein n=1 Tax=Haemophilus influenzae TaxID=727 RepID=UPI0006660EC8|nr:KilA-N domain-containing protein [Haemophilus influenzae]KMZ14058.1 DNA-binding protein [Haemophilus influenzae]MCK9006874.1 KilA-N domain-containing protein [Haemophilus influenzae]MCK9654957.1 KilA-N domain-containing protein [Haemophilus influenzae]PRI35098.1 KilA-N domain protein [Haemophilus influenzae]PRI39279.1 KilA-N domain protein [Haemophilus influenzae]
MANDIIVVQGVEIKVTQRENEDYISLTDMCKAFGDGDQLIKNWLQNKNTIEFLQVWEELNNPNFNLVELHQIKNNVGLNRFVMSVKKWSTTNAIGLIAKTGRYGSGTYAHKDIALEFGSWLSPEFKLYLIKEFQRLKQKEAEENKLEWNIKRILTKANYRIHTDAIKAHLIPQLLNTKQHQFVYATEADILNQALFGQTAKQWKDANPELKGNMREHATIEQLTVLASLESQNALLIQQGISQEERLAILNRLAIQQMNSLLQTNVLEQLKEKPLLQE